MEGLAKSEELLAFSITGILILCFPFLLLLFLLVRWPWQQSGTDYKPYEPAALGYIVANELTFFSFFAFFSPPSVESDAGL